MRVRKRYFSYGTVYTNPCMKQSVLLSAEIKMNCACASRVTHLSMRESTLAQRCITKVKVPRMNTLIITVLPW